MMGSRKSLSGHRQRQYRVTGLVVHISERGIYSFRQGTIYTTPQIGPAHRVEISSDYMYNYVAVNDTKDPIALVAGRLWHIRPSANVLPSKWMSDIHSIDYSPMVGYVVHGNRSVIQLGELDTYLPTYFSKSIGYVFLSRTSTSIYVLRRNPKLDNDILQIAVLADRVKKHTINVPEGVMLCDLQPDSSDIITCANSQDVCRLDLWRASGDIISRICPSPSMVASPYKHYDRNTLIFVNVLDIHIMDLRSGLYRSIERTRQYCGRTNLWCVQSQSAIYTAVDSIVDQYI